MPGLISYLYVEKDNLSHYKSNAKFHIDKTNIQEVILI